MESHTRKRKTSDNEEESKRNKKEEHVIGKGVVLWEAIFQNMWGKREAV